MLLVTSCSSSSQWASVIGAVLRPWCDTSRCSDLMRSDSGVALLEASVSKRTSSSVCGVGVGDSDS